MYTRDDAKFTQGEKEQMIESFKRKKAPGMDGNTSDIFLRTFNKFPRLVTAIYNQCLKRGSFQRRWKTANIIPIAKPGQENSMEPSKYRPINLLNVGGKVLEKHLINRRTDAHTHTHARAHAHTHKNARARTSSHTRARARARTHTHTRTREEVNPPANQQCTFSLSLNLFFYLLVFIFSFLCFCKWHLDCTISKT